MTDRRSIGLAQRLQLLGDRAPAGGEAHLLVAFHRLVGPMARPAGEAGAARFGFDLPAADHEGAGGGEAAIFVADDRVGGDEALARHDFGEHSVTRRAEEQTSELQSLMRISYT